MEQFKQVDSIAVDWGTTYLRAYGLSSEHQIIALEILLNLRSSHKKGLALHKFYLRF